MQKILWPLLAAILVLAPFGALAMGENDFRDQLNAMRKKGEKPQAIIDFVEKTIADSPDASSKMLSNGQAAIGEAYGQLGEVDKAIEHCQEALKIKQTAFANVTFFNLLLKKMDYTGAYNYLEKGIALAESDSQREQLEKRGRQIAAKYLAVPASKLYTAFDENEVAAEDEYKGKNIFVKGKISAITTDALGHPVVSLNTGKNILAKVNCVFPKDARAKIAKLKKGTEAVIRGECDGMTMGAVFIKNCIS